MWVVDDKYSELKWWFLLYMLYIYLYIGYCFGLCILLKLLYVFDSVFCLFFMSLNVYYRKGLIIVLYGDIVCIEFFIYSFLLLWYFFCFVKIKWFCDFWF